ncbi:MAG: molybdopterin molybdotransferase MoeA [Pelagibacterales bacterium]|nr:molybdopterin molybdotransferase MoeA [Pelagibacterales bacterium]
MIEYRKAQKILLNSKIKIQNEIIFSKNSLNRISAKNIFSPTNYPAGNNTAFDGYAVNSKETVSLSNKNKKKFKILKTIAAGDNPKIKNVKKYSSVEIMTGALIPKHFDTVIPIEKINYYPNKKNPKFIIIEKKITKNNHVRFAGSDYKKGEKIVSAGEIINSSHILAFKSLGVERIVVKKKPVVVFYSTGNEITEKTNIPDWKVRNSNSHYIKSLSKNLFFNFIDGGILRDKDDKLFKKLINKNFKSKYDIVITNGAVSAGKFDFVPRIIKNFKLSNHFKGVAIRPGKPIMFAKFKNINQSFFGLPGNPISSAACFKFFVYPYLRSILNMKNERPFKAKLKNSYSKKKNFTRFLKSKVLINKKGALEVEVLKGQESFRIKSFTKANAWALFRSGKSAFKKGELIECFNPLGS